MQFTLVILISVMIAGLGVWKEISRPSKARLAWRISCVLLASAAFAGLVLPVSYSSALSKNEADEAVLLTEGFSADSLSALPNRRVYTLEPEIHRQYPKAALLADAGLISELKPAVTGLHISGYGLTEEQLSQLRSIPVKVHAPALPDGLRVVNFTQQLYTGQRFQVQGSYHNAAGKTVKLLLKGLGTGLDSVTLSSKPENAFSLNAVPKHTGRAVYQLLALNGKDTVEQEPLPLTVEGVKPVSILLLSASPDFENKFLKNWLSAGGYSAAIRSAISKGKTTTEFVNMAQLPLDKLSASALEKFDVLATDLTSLKTLSPAETSVLQEQVSQKGLGVIVRADTGMQTSAWLQSGFPVSKAPGQKPEALKLTINGNRPLTAGISVAPAYLNNRPGTQPFVTDGQGHVLAAVKLAGAGRVALTTLIQTYPWALAGNNAAYNALWAALLNKVARKQPPVANWQVTSALPAAGSPVNLTLQAAAAPQSWRFNQTGAAPQQNALLPFEWTATYQPSAPGWQQTQVDAHTTYFWYAYEKNAWTPLKNQEKQQATRLYTANHPLNTSVTKLIQQNIRIEVPKIYFYILLLLSFSYLWAESRWMKA